MALARLHLAIDLGAGSGRAIVGGITPSGLILREIHRFHYGPRLSRDHLRWDIEAVFAGIRDGLGRAPAIAAELGGAIESVGVDSWGVDYGLVNSAGELLEEPIAYRDGRTDGVMEDVRARIGRDEIFARTGIQFLPFNTLYQLVAHLRDGWPEGVSRVLMIPDLCHHMLCGSLSGEYTNATTTQLLDLAGHWEPSLFDQLALPLDQMPDLVKPGVMIGSVRPSWQSELNVGPLRVIAPATHDTGSAVVGTPLRAGWAYISSGTWSLVGVERSTALINPAAARANFTNEGGAFGTIRLLKNVMGLWILERCRKEWEEAGHPFDYSDLLERVGQQEGVDAFIYPDDPRFFNPPSMGDAIRLALIENGHRAPDDPVLIGKIVLDSLALRYASVVETIEALTGVRTPGIHIVGGGSLNAYLNQSTADAAQRPVLAGPVEATAFGNIMVQAIGCGVLGSLEEARLRLSDTVSPREFRPRHSEAWSKAREAYRRIEAAYL